MKLFGNKAKIKILEETESSFRSALGAFATLCNSIAAEVEYGALDDGIEIEIGIEGTFKNGEWNVEITSDVRAK